MADAYLKVKDNGAQGLALAREETDVSVNDLKTQIEKINKDELGFNLCSAGNFLNVPSGITYSYNASEDSVTVTSTSSVANQNGCFTDRELLNLEAGKTYRFHAVAELESGKAPMRITIRGKEGAPGAGVLTLEGEGELQGDFVATGYEKYVTIFMRWNDDNYPGTVKYSDIYIKEVTSFIDETEEWMEKTAENEFRDNLCSAKDFITDPSGITHTYNVIDDSITVVSTSSVKDQNGCITDRELLNLEAGKTYRFHAVAELVSGKAPMRITIRGKEGSPGAGAFSLIGQGELEGEFVATGYEKYVTIFMRWGNDTYPGTVKYSDIYLREVAESAIDVKARRALGIENLPNKSIESNIVYLNRKIYDDLLQAKRPLNSTVDPYTERVQPLVLLWFSDIHGYKVELQRMVELKNYYSALIDDAICTGDMVYRKYSDGMSFWDSVDGAENIIMCMGNHDAWKPNASTLASQTEQYNQYFAPYIENWDCEYESGKTYFYKDYAEKNIRLIAINCMLSGEDETAQRTWFEETLSGAKTAGYAVIVMNHYAPPGIKIDSGFSSVDFGAWTNGLNEAYPQMVDAFQQNEGEFICWLAGHEHIDQFTKGLNYPNQRCMVIAALCSVFDDPLYSGDNQRTAGTKSQDLANMIVFDTSSKAVKVIRIGSDKDHYLRPRNCLTFKYLTGEILCDY